MRAIQGDKKYSKESLGALLGSSTMTSLPLEKGLCPLNVPSAADAPILVSVSNVYIEVKGHHRLWGPDYSGEPPLSLGNICSG